MEKITALYIRVSHEEQKLNGDSLRVQKEELIKYCNNHNIKNYKIYEDAGVSAVNYKQRYALKELLEEVEADLIEQILFVRLDRWSRNHTHHKIQEILDKHNVPWISITQNLETKTASGRLMVNVLLSVAQNEIEQTSERLKFIMRNKILNGEYPSGNTPFGYMLHNKRLVPHPENSVIQKFIFEKYIELQSMADVLRLVNLKYNIKIKRSEYKKVLLDKIYLGVYDRNGIYIENYCEPLITIDQYETIERLLQLKYRKKPINNHTYIFTGMIHCPCGGRMCGSTKIPYKDKPPYFHYKCITQNSIYSKNNKSCKQPSINEKTIERIMLEELKKYIKNEEVKISTNSKEYKQDSENTLKNIKSKMNKLTDLYVNDLIDREYYEKEFKLLKEQENKLITKNIPRKKVNINELKSVFEIYDNLDNLQKRIFWSKIVHKIEIIETKKVNRMNEPKLKVAFF